MIDTHAHLDFPDFDQDRGEVITRAFDNARLDSPDGGRARRGVKKIINIGVDLGTSKKSIKLAEKHENIFASVGMHPGYFTDHAASFQGSTFPSASLADSSRSNLFEKDFEELKKLAKNKKVVAVGECGLDYFRIKKLDFSRGNPVSIEKIKKNQKEGFIAQIELAQELNLPVIIHCRDAWRDLYEIVKSQIQNPNIQINPKSQIQKNKNIPYTIYQIPATKFVLHCYSGGKEDTEKFLELPNVCFSFSGNITYTSRRSSHPSVPRRYVGGHLPSGRGGNLEEAVRMIPLERMMLDSDSPFLAPQQVRGKRNEPSYVRYIAEKIAEIKEIILEEVEKMTDKNANEFFGLD